MEKKYGLLQGLERLNDRHKKKCELIRGLQDAHFYTEEELVATMLESAEEDTFFRCTCIGFDVATLSEPIISYAFTLYCNDYFVKR